MSDLSDLVTLSTSIFAAVFRVLWWIIRDFLLEKVLCSLGWVALKLLTFGRYPGHRFGENDAAGRGIQFLEMVTGIFLLGVFVWFLSGAGPRFW